MLQAFGVGFDQTQAMLPKSLADRGHWPGGAMHRFPDTEVVRQTRDESEGTHRDGAGWPTAVTSPLGHIPA